MRIYPDTITEIIEQSELNVNQISKLSGISNTYITKLLKKKVNHPGKDKIASLLLALNYSITDINKILAEYDYMPLSGPDIPGILENNRRRKFEGRIMPHYDHIYFELLMAALERIGGTKIIIKSRPSGIHIPIALYLQKEFPAELADNAANFFMAFTKDLVMERKALFLENCRKGYRYETYMCRHCLEESLERHIGRAAQTESMEKVALYTEYYVNAISASLKAPEQHRHYIMKRCPYFDCQIQDAEGPNSKISFTGRRRHFYHKEWEQLSLESFLSDAPGIVDVFLNEVERCKEGVEMEPMEEKSALSAATHFHQFILDIFIQHGLGDLLETKLKKIMNSSSLIFF